MTIDHIVRSAVSTMLMLAVVAACSDDNNVVNPPPPVPVASVVVSPATHTLRVGELVTLQASPKAADGSSLDRPVVWSSEDETLATVTSNGAVTTLAVGQVAIRATSEGRIGRSTITIQPKPAANVAEVRLSADNEIQLEWDGTMQIGAKAFDAVGNELFDRQVEWMTSKPSIATVSSGKIEAPRRRSSRSTRGARAFPCASMPATCPAILPHRPTARSSCLRCRSRPCRESGSTICTS